MKIKFLTVLSLAVVLLLGACGGKSDAELKTASEAALKGETTTSGVTVEVKDGVATISGEVESEEAKAKAAEVAKVEGVKSVTNEVTVKAPPPPPTASAEDGPLKTKVEESLKNKGCANVTVEVKDGVATISGEVAKGKLGECVMAANEAKPKKVENKLTEKK
jgi:osmotically-inducible protein OsmY